MKTPALHQGNIDRGFFTILASQFLSALADNALFPIAILIFKALNPPPEQISLLLHVFALSYVLLAPFVGAFADSMPKGKVMLICNGIKLAGCLLLIGGAHPLLAYAVVGFGAAAYSPAKYGIITEYLPHDKLVAANGWLEGATVTAIIFGTALGGLLLSAPVQTFVTSSLPIDPITFAACCAAVIYGIAGIINLFVPRLPLDHKPVHRNPTYLFRDFWHAFTTLWKDPQGQLSLTVTTLFWGVGATMRYVVLDWAILWLAMRFDQATYLVAIVGVGTVLGAMVAGHRIQLKNSFSVIPAGIIMGLLVMVMLWVGDWVAAGVLMIIIGAMSGFFVVPLNAMLQHRGHLLLGAGHSIAVQNFNENLSILVMLGGHFLLVKYFVLPMCTPDYQTGVPPVSLIVVVFGGFVALVMTGVYLVYKRRNADGTLRSKQA